MKTELILTDKKKEEIEVETTQFLKKYLRRTDRLVLRKTKACIGYGMFLVLVTFWLYLMWIEAI